MKRPPWSDIEENDPTRREFSAAGCARLLSFYFTGHVDFAAFGGGRRGGGGYRGVSPSSTLLFFVSTRQRLRVSVPPLSGYE